jgi:hypothetical protein
VQVQYTFRAGVITSIDTSSLVHFTYNHVRCDYGYAVCASEMAVLAKVSFAGNTTYYPYRGADATTRRSYQHIRATRANHWRYKL